MGSVMTNWQMYFIIANMYMAASAIVGGYKIALLVAAAIYFVLANFEKFIT